MSSSTNLVEFIDFLEGRLSHKKAVLDSAEQHLKEVQESYDTAKADYDTSAEKVKQAKIDQEMLEAYKELRILFE